MRGLLILLGLLLASAASAAPPARIAIIIDDLGNNLELGRQSIDLPGALTYAILPQLPFSRELAQRAHRAGKEVMLHLPMQAADGRALGPGGLDMEMGRQQFARALHANLAAVPHVVGVNNHMGSLLTRHPGAMEWLMQDLRCAGELYFVDSRTDVRTVARRLAREAGLPNAQRDVFLDNVQDPDYIHNQVQRLIAVAKRRGFAIGIGHPYPTTLRALADALPLLAAQAIELVPVSRLVEPETEEPLWHACWSPLQTAAKNSRP